MKQKISFGLAAIFLAVCLFLGINGLSYVGLRGMRVDLTQSQLYTLSSGTESLVGKIKEPIRFRLYYSQKLGEAVPHFGNYAMRVEEMLREYAGISQGKIIFEKSDPAPYSAEEDRAMAYGLQAVPINETGDVVYFGLVATNSADSEAVIPFFQPEREPFLEYDLSKMVSMLIRPERPTVGLMSFLPMENDMFLSQTKGVMGASSWTVVDQMKENFDVISINPRATRFDDVDVLMIVHPKNLSDETEFAIDQFALKGGKILMFVDPHSEAEVSRQFVVPGQEQQTGSNVPRLLHSWGLDMADGKIVADRTLARRVRVPGVDGGPERVAPYVGWLGVPTEFLNAQDPITGEMNQLVLASAGSLQRLPETHTHFEALVTSSRDVMLLDAKDMRVQPDVLGLLETFKPMTQNQVLAARISGRAYSAFSEKMGQEGFVSDGNINVIVVADTDLLEDRFWVDDQKFFGQSVVFPTSDNGALVLNTLDDLAGSGDLIGLRGRSTISRPFDKIVEMRMQAEQELRARESNLQKRLNMIREKMKSLQYQGGENGALLSPEQRDAMKNFRAEILSTRAELRDVQYQLHKDIDGIYTKIRLIAIGLVPMLVMVLALVFYARARRMNNKVWQA